MQRMVQSRAIRPSGGQLDILESLGLVHTQKIYEQRVKALATPGVYNRERKDEWDKMAAAGKKRANLVMAGYLILIREVMCSAHNSHRYTGSGGP